MPAKDVPHAIDQSAVDVGLFNGPADDGDVILALTWDGKRLARLPAGTAEIAVVERDGDEDPLRESARRTAPILLPLIPPMPWAMTTADRAVASGR